MFQPCWNHSKAFHAIQCQNVGYIIDIWGILGHYLVFYYESNWESSVKALVVCCATYGGSGNIASSHEDHLVDDRGGTPWWCDLLSAGLHRHRLDSWIDPISTYQQWNALLQYVACWVWPRLILEGQILDSTWMVRQYIHAAYCWMVATLLTTS